MLSDLSHKDTEQTTNLSLYYFYYWIISCDAEAVNFTRKNTSWEAVLEIRRKQMHKTFQSKTLNKTSWVKLWQTTCHETLNNYFVLYQYYNQWHYIIYSDCYYSAFEKYVICKLIYIYICNILHMSIKLHLN